MASLVDLLIVLTDESFSSEYIFSYKISKVTYVQQIKEHKNRNDGGFTIVEIIVVVFITSIIVSMVVFRYRDFSDSIELENMALDVVLSVREAQVFGISSRGTTTMESFFHAYGVHFASVDDDSYISFIDSDGDNLWYDIPSEQFRKTIFMEGYLINDLCVITPPSSLEDCTPTELDILFQRPDVNAIIKTAANSISTFAKIELISPSGATTSVNISESGQVYID